MIHRIPILLITAAISAPPCLGGPPDHNWHQWRGPEANGVSRTANPPVLWSETKNVRWKTAIDGKGTSTPIVWDHQVFLLTTIETNEKDTSIPDPEDQPKTNFFDIKRPNIKHAFVVLCLDRQTGQEIWRQTATIKIPHEGAHHDNDFASASPTTDGTHLYCWFGSAGLYCFDLDGNRIWQRDLGEVRVGSSLGEGASPVLHDGRLVIIRDHAGASSIEVIDATSGQTLWKQPRDEGNAWSTPIVIRHSGKSQIITAASNAIRSYDLESGEIIWQCTGLTGNVIPSPVVCEDSVICMSGYQVYAAIALPLSATGDLSTVDHAIWSRHRGTPYIPSPLLYDDLLLFNQGNQSIVTGLNPTTGDISFGPDRLGQLSNIYSSPVGAASRIYVTDRGGTTLVMQKSPSHEVLAINKLDDRFDASPAVVGTQLFLRGARNLYCLEDETGHPTK
ncbi:MAG: PQQ-binding-like beta-propeller repeat protein [Planctomycetota bacterium]